MDGLCRVPKTAALHVKARAFQSGVITMGLGARRLHSDRPREPGPKFDQDCDRLLQHGGDHPYFPSGTRSDENIAFKRGAATLALHARVPLVPAFFQGRSICKSRTSRIDLLSG